MNEKLSTNDVLKLGMEAHSAGQLEKADEYYTAILKFDPKHPPANHNLGQIASQVGDKEQALFFLKTALEGNNSHELFWRSYMDCLIKFDHLDDAKLLLNEAKEKNVSQDLYHDLEQRLVSSGKA